MSGPGPDKRGGGGDRPARVGERIRKELMEMLLRGAIKDPGVSGAVIHAVEVSGDLQHARIFVRLMEPDPSEARRRALMRGLSRASGYLRRQIAATLGTRYTPELRFEWDDTAERATRIESILDELRHERRQKSPEPNGEGPGEGSSADEAGADPLRVDEPSGDGE